MMIDCCYKHCAFTSVINQQLLEWLLSISGVVLTIQQKLEVIELLDSSR